MTEIKFTAITEEDTYTATQIEITDGDQVIGWATAISGDEGTYIERIDIDEQFRNAGHGTEALRLMSEQFNGIYLAPDNEDAQRLYERIGCEYRGQDAEYVDQGFGVYEI